MGWSLGTESLVGAISVISSYLANAGWWVQFWNAPSNLLVSVGVP